MFAYTYTKLLAFLEMFMDMAGGGDYLNTACHSPGRTCMYILPSYVTVC